MSDDDAAVLPLYGWTLLISSMGLHQLQQYPEARALQQGIYDWLVTMPAPPEQELSLDEVRRLVK